MLNRLPIKYLSDPVEIQEYHGACRTHLESLQNIRHLLCLEAEHPDRIRLHLQMMKWHLHKLENVLLQPA